MSELLCPVCGEVVELGELHHRAEDLDMSFDSVYVAWVSEGCPALGFACLDPGDSVRSVVAGVVLELAGDDVDFAAEMMNDFCVMQGSDG